MQDPSMIIFALLAVFILWKLRSVLGTRTGQEKPPFNPFSFRRSQGQQGPNGAPQGSQQPNNDNKVVSLPGAAARPQEQPSPAWTQPAATPVVDRWKDYAAPGSKVAAGLDAIAAAEPGFAIEEFVAGAKRAYEMIVAAFAAGDRQSLQNLLDQDVFQSFAAAISGRESRGEKVKTTVVSVDQVGLEDAMLRNRTAQITLRFASKLVSATENAAGTIIEGSPDRIVDMVDIWTFAREIGSRNPNWKLVATQSGH